jgi:hypothetical protein
MTEQYQTAAAQNLAALWYREWQPRLDAALEDASPGWRFAIRPLLGMLDIEGLLTGLDNNPERLGDIKKHLEKALAAIADADQEANTYGETTEAYPEYQAG